MTDESVTTIISYENAAVWLNEFQGRETFESPPTRQWMRVIEIAMQKRNYAQCRALIEELDAQLPRLHNPELLMELAETAFDCAYFFVRMGDYQAALRYLRRALGQYVINPHNQAVTRWLIGCVLWELPARYGEAIGEWQAAQQAFERQANSAIVDPPLATWYEERSTEMLEAIEYAISLLADRSQSPFSAVL